jgi:glycosyltransferase involved in cell wall biosynthesis
MTVFEPRHRTIRPSPAFPEVRSRGSALRRWTLNGDFVTLARNGVARYASEVASALDDLVAEGHELTKDLELDVVVPRAVGHSLALRAIAIRTVPEFSKPRLPQVWVQLQLPRHVPGGLVSLCNLAPLSVRRQIVCMHDLQTRLVPESFGRMFRLAHRVLLPALGRRVAGVTTVSTLSCQHLIDFGVAQAERITVTYNGCDHAMRWNAAIGSLAPARRPYVLCIGRMLKYKNLDLLLRLAPELDAIGVDLWMAGDVVSTSIAAAGPWPENLRLLGRISDDDFAQALSGAEAFLLPSRIEGFGLPAVEAMASGCPVVASTSPCLPEVCGDAALYADPDDVGAWIAGVARLLKEPTLRRRQVALGHTRAATYSWRRVAEQYLELMWQIDMETPARGMSRGEAA